MKKLTDEMLNKLIDNELSSSEIDELFNLIKNDEKLLSKTKAHQMVDDVLKTIKVEAAPLNTSELIMERISNSVLHREKKNGFIKFIMGSFVTLIVLVIGFLFISNKSPQRISGSYFSTAKNKVLEFLPNISISINNNILIAIASSITVVLLISFYLLFEEHKSFKQKLDSIL